MPEPRARDWNRIRRCSLLPVICLALLATSTASAVVLTGEVRSLGAQPLYVPPLVGSNMVMLQMYVEDGVRVQKGDAVLRIDASRAATQLQQLRDNITKTRFENAASLAKLQLDVVDAQIELVEARAAEQTAAIDAALPADLIPAIDHDQYQGVWNSSKHKVDLARGKLAEARAATQRSRDDGAIQLKKLQMELDFNQSQVDSATIHAKLDGTVVHAFMTYSFNGQPKGRYEQGSNAFQGSQVGKVVPPDSRFAVHAWVLESDRDQVRQGQNVRLDFDALPGSMVDGTITDISGTATPKPSWGSGRYFELEIQATDDIQHLKLLPGMSVRVLTDPGAASSAKPATPTRAPPTSALQATGQVYARDSIPIIPPQIPGLWQLNIVQMADDGAQVEKGEAIVTFAAGNTAQKLPEARSELAEKERALENLAMDLEKKSRTSELAIAKARAEADKAHRKAQQPEAYVAGVEYKKLVIDRQRAARVLELTQQRGHIAARYHKAQLQQAQTEISILEHEVQRLTEAMAKLTVRAPRRGIFLHRSTWSGEKYDVGSQVFRGITIADLPDLSTLGVKASLPEHDYARVQVDQTVTITLSGGIGRQLRGHVRSIGRSVHSKSRAEPEPVIDLDIALDEGFAGQLKPGQPVQITIHPQDQETSP